MWLVAIIPPMVFAAIAVMSRYAGRRNSSPRVLRPDQQALVAQLEGDWRGGPLGFQLAITVLDLARGRVRVTSSAAEHGRPLRVMLAEHDVVWFGGDAKRLPPALLRRAALVREEAIVLAELQGVLALRVVGDGEVDALDILGHAPPVRYRRTEGSNARTDSSVST